MSTSTLHQNPNSGLLEGFACPECGSFGPFEIEESTLVTYFDEDFGRHEYLGYDTDSYCRCPACQHDGQVCDFKTETGGA